MTAKKTGKPTGRKTQRLTTKGRQTVESKPKPTPPSRGPRGHRGIIAGISLEKGVHDAEDTSALCAGVPATNGRAGSADIARRLLAADSGW